MEGSRFSPLGYDVAVDLPATIKQRALEIGFDLAGIAPLGAWRDWEFARRWVEQGRGGEMRYLANPKRNDPRLILPSVQSVICVGLVYNAPLPFSTEVGSRASEVGKKSSVVSGQLSVAEKNEQPATDDGPRATDHGQLTTDHGQGTRDAPRHAHGCRATPGAMTTMR